MEQPIISGVAHDLADAKLTLVAVPDKPGIAATIFETVASNGVNVDMIVQNIAASDTNKTDVTFTLPKTDGKKAVAAIENIKEQIQYQDLILDENIAKISLVGAGMKSHPGVSANFFRALAKAGVNIEMISTSEIRISVVTRAEDAVKAVQAIHSAFDLDAESEATVHAGTGR